MLQRHFYLRLIGPAGGSGINGLRQNFLRKPSQCWQYAEVIYRPYTSLLRLNSACREDASSRPPSRRSRTVGKTWCACSVVTLGLQHEDRETKSTVPYRWHIFTVIWNRSKRLKYNDSNTKLQSINNTKHKNHRAYRSIIIQSLHFSVLLIFNFRWQWICICKFPSVFVLCKDAAVACKCIIGLSLIKYIFIYIKANLIFFQPTKYQDWYLAG